MKKILLFLILLFSTAIYSQAVDLQKLSTGELVVNMSIYTKIDEEINGHLYVFKKDMVAKNEFLYEYILVDKGLNKILSGEFTEKLGDDARAIYINCMKHDDIVSFTIDEAKAYQKIRTRFRLLDLRENKLSDPFILDENLEKVYNAASKSRKESRVFSLKPDANGYHLHTPVQKNKNNDPHTYFGSALFGDERTRGVSYFNEKLELQWSFAYNETGTEKEYESVYLLGHSKGTDFFQATKFQMGIKNIKKRAKGKLFDSYLFLDKHTGKLVSEISPYGLKTANGMQAKVVSTKEQKIDDGKITFVSLIMSAKSKTFILDENKIIGFSKSEYEISTGKELSRQFFTWDKLSPYIPIDENAYVIEKGEPNSYLYFHSPIIKSNGKLIIIAEQYKTLSGNFLIHGFEGVKIDDMIIFELDKDMNVVQFKRIAKDSKNIRNGITMQGTSANLHKAFDYNGYHDLGGDDYQIYYYNKQKPEDGGKKQKTYVIITYKNGVFTEEKIPLKTTEGSELEISHPKHGYIRIVETFKDKETEIRLEKIN